MPVSESFYTKSVHAGVAPDERTGAVMTPIYQTSTYAQQAPGEHAGWDYSRGGNPTRDVLEAAYAELEGAEYGLSFASGLAAEQAIIQALVQPGDEILVCDDVYGGTGRLFRQLFAHYGLKFQFLDMTDAKQVEQAASSKSKLIWVETPTNPTLKVIDIRSIANIAKQANATLVVDNTFCSPVFQQPLSLGADIVMHSTTKYIGGHSDIVGGAVMTSNADLYEKIKFVQFAAGSISGPLECFLLLRSLKTLAVRMKQHETNANAVARFLDQHKGVKQVYFPGLEKHPGYQIAQEQTSGNSGMVSFDLDGTYEDVLNFLSKLKVFVLAESLGGVESLVNHPERMTHASVPEEMRRKLGIGPTLLRLSVGIEAEHDLIADLDQALS